MRNYQTTIKFTLGIIIVLQVSLILLGFLRPSIVYDYLDYWPLIIIPLVLLITTRNTEYKERVIVYAYSFLISVALFFNGAHILKANFLTTYSYDSDFQSLNLNKNFEYQLYIDENNSIDLVSFLGNGYKVGIIDKPGKSGYPETVETLLGSPRAILFRQIDTSPLLRVKGWVIQLGSENLWQLNLFSVDSKINLDNLKLSPSFISGTGELHLGANLELTKLVLNGKFEVIVSKELPIVVKGTAEFPDSWLNATIGRLNHIDQTYKLEIEIIDGSQVLFKDE